MCGKHYYIISIHNIVLKHTMAELNEQQTHLASLLKQREDIVNEINELTAKAESKKELLLRTLGAVEYLQQVGVKLPEPEEAKMTEETPEVEGEVVEGEWDLPEPTVEG